MHSLDQYDYELPRERIAQEPLANRIDARLMIIDRKTGTFDHAHVRDLPDHLRAEDALVLNNSHVVPARLVGYRTRTGGRWQGLFLRCDRDTGIWELLTKTRGSLATGETITIQDRDGRDGMQLAVMGRADDGHLFARPAPESIPDVSGRRDKTSDDASDASLPDPVDLLERYGRVPLPPYIRDGQMVDADVARYQTVYASDKKEDFGSVAAPTAGLHFTKSLLKDIEKGQTAIHEVTLHVGVGTFRPIDVEDVDQHQMHAEWGRLDAATCQSIEDRRAAGGRCVAVGTTSVRVLESAVAAGGGELHPWTGQTDLFIKPPYQFGAVDALMTNFHLPKSSLLVLVSAFAGRELMLEAYREAIAQEYRFFSYGDAMLIV